MEMTKVTTTVVETIGWYDFVKDIVIPSLGIIITIVFGSLINTALKNKEEKAKKKILLIDSYMEYLKARAEDSFYYTVLSRLETLLYIKAYSREFIDNINEYFVLKLIDSRIEKVTGELQSLGMKRSNWDNYTYKFYFLLGKKVYLKEIQSLEDELVLKIKSKEYKETFYNSLYFKIKTSPIISQKLNSNDENSINLGLNLLENLIIVEYHVFQEKTFGAFNQKIADIIGS